LGTKARAEQVTKLFLEFFKTEKASGVILIACTVFSLVLANTQLRESYASIWQFMIAGQPISYWINDGLMTVFFLLVGLEIEREIYIGELSQPRKALLPIIAALGGMVVPALFHFSLNAGTATQSGMGIPMATDIAFALGVLALLGNRVPFALKVFLTALAIIDDLGAIVMIGLFYSKGISVTNLLISAFIILVLAICNRLKVRHLAFYLISGIVLWYFIHESGIHATVTGVILAFLIPFDKNEETSPSGILQHRLHYIVAFGILPIFALANTNLTIGSDWYSSLLSPNSLGIILGLVLGKLFGISIFSFVAVKARLCSLPADVGWRDVIGVSILGGIGFTMSIFISLLAFGDLTVIEQSKIAILVASTIAGITGFIVLKLVLRPAPPAFADSA